ncbi:MAG TPA: hypothetical protein VJH03_24865 [Blastocatellia bacterium]|nr:hypothetical protein [Blastocatellia bacterium]
MLDEYRDQYVEFNASWMREHYLHLSGQKSELELADIYDRHSGLFTEASIAGLRQHLAALPQHYEADRVAVGRLLLFAIEHFEESAAKELTESLSRYEGEAATEWRGQKLTFQDCAVAVRTQHDRDARRVIHQRREDMIEASNEMRAARTSSVHGTARKLGFSSYIALYEQMRKIDYAALAHAASSVISRTEPVYTRRLSEALKRDLGIPIEKAERSDALFLLHMAGYDDRFPGTELLRTYEATMAGLGIRAGEQRNILIDSEPRPRKSSRAFCVPISIPDDVRLVLRAMGGQTDYQALLHEAGHAQHYGWTSPDLKPEFKYTGDYALTETYAFLFNHLITEREWLAESLGFRDSESFILSATLARLLTLRRYVAKLTYECELHKGGDISQVRESYGELQTEATGFRTSSAEFLFDIDDGFYSANYLRAWALEVAFADYLRTRFGKSWWRSRRAGGFLKELWETGERFTADEIAAQLGLGPISFDALSDEFNRALN